MITHIRSDLESSQHSEVPGIKIGRVTSILSVPQRQTRWLHGS